jgi:hypothetical protein
MIHRSPAIPFIDVENDIAPDAYHTFEVVPTTYIPEGPPSRGSLTATSWLPKL